MIELTRIAEKQIKESIQPEYQKQVTEEEGLGMAISKHYQWEPAVILRLVYVMFEDANMHTENKTVEKWLAKWS